MAKPQSSEAEQAFKERIIRALKTPPISNEEIERRSKAKASKQPDGATYD